MKIGKKLVAVLAIALLMFSASSSLVGLNAQDITFTTTDFYLADDKGTKVGSLDITDRSEFTLQFIRENSLDRNIIIHVPTGIYWDQEQTEGGVNPSDVEFKHEEDSSDIIINYGYDENANMMTNMMKLFFEKTDQFTGDEMVTAETTRDDEVLASEPLYLKEVSEDINLGENLVVTDEATETVDKNEPEVEEEGSSLSDSDDDLEVSLMHSYSNGEEVKVTLTTAIFYTDIIVKNKSDKNIENIVINDTVSEHMEAKSGTMEVDGIRMRKDQEIILWNGFPMGRYGKELTMNVPVLEPGESTHLHWATWASPIMEGLTYTGLATEKLKVEAEDTEYTDEHTVKLLRDLATPYIETRIKDEDGNEVEGAEVGDVLTFEYTGTLDTTIMGIFDTYYLETLPDYLEYQPNTTYIEGELVEDDSVWEGNKFEFFKDYQVPGEYLVIKFKVLVKGLSPAETLYSKMTTQKENGMKKRLWEKEFLLRQNGSENPRITAENKVTDEDGSEVQEAKIGEILHYKVKGTNNAGMLFGNEVILRDELPDYLEYQPGSTTVNGAAVEDGAFWEGNTLEVMADLLPGSDIEAEFAVKVLGVETIENENFVINCVSTGSRDDDDPSVAEVRLKEEAQEPEEDRESLALDQAVLDVNGENIDGQEVESGDDLHYQITAVNDGNTVIENPIVKDVLENGLDLKENSTTLDGEDIEDEVVWSGKSLQLVANKLEPGDKMTVDFIVTVNDDAQEMVENTGFVGIGDDSTLKTIKDLKPTPTVVNSIKASGGEEGETGGEGDGDVDEGDGDVDEGSSGNSNSGDVNGGSQTTDTDPENFEKELSEKASENKGDLPKTGSSLGIVAISAGMIFLSVALLIKRSIR